MVQAEKSKENLTLVIDRSEEENVFLMLGFFTQQLASTQLSSARVPNDHFNGKWCSNIKKNPYELVRFSKI